MNNKRNELYKKCTILVIEISTSKKKKFQQSVYFNTHKSVFKCTTLQNIKHTHTSICIYF